MLSFRAYFQENVVTTKRSGMLHLQKMDDAEFVVLVQSIAKDMKGKLKDLSVNVKVDGLGGRFGKDANGKKFFESSRSGPIFEPKHFSAYAENKGMTGESLLRAYKYDDLWDDIMQIDAFSVLPNNTKVVCEIFYNPMAEMEGDGIRFVTITYDKAKLGDRMTIIPFEVLDASTGEKRDDSDEIIAKIIKTSNKEVKIATNKLSVEGEIDIKAKIDPVLSMNKDTIAVLKSRKKEDVENKQNLKTIIQSVKDNLADYILNHPQILDKTRFGKEIEGLVLDFGGKMMKVTTPKFKAAKANER